MNGKKPAAVKALPQKAARPAAKKQSNNSRPNVPRARLAMDELQAIGSEIRPRWFKLIESGMAYPLAAATCATAYLPSNVRVSIKEAATALLKYVEPKWKLEQPPGAPPRANYDMALEICFDVAANPDVAYELITEVPAT